MTRRPRPQVFGYCFKRKFFIRFEKKNTCPHVAHQIVIARTQVCRGILVFHRMK